MIQRTTTISQTGAVRSVLARLLLCLCLVICVVLSLKGGQNTGNLTIWGNVYIAREGALGFHGDTLILHASIAGPGPLVVVSHSPQRIVAASTAKVSIGRLEVCNPAGLSLSGSLSVGSVYVHPGSYLLPDSGSSIRILENATHKPTALAAPTKIAMDFPLVPTSDDCAFVGLQVFPPPAPNTWPGLSLLLLCIFRPTPLALLGLSGHHLAQYSACPLWLMSPLLSLPPDVPTPPPRA